MVYGNATHSAAQNPSGIIAQEAIVFLRNETFMPVFYIGLLKPGSLSHGSACILDNS